MSQSIWQPGSALDNEQAGQDMVAKVPQEAETIESRISSLKLDFSKGDQVLYAFDPINTETQIRILVLEPPAPSNPNALRGTLVTATLADRPLYEALSYAWGDPVFPELISFPSSFLPITANLASALRRLRFPDRPRKLWADAICINQRDNVEKGHQVSLMSKIFKYTQCTLVWLGNGEDWGHSAFLLVKEMSSLVERLGIAANRFLSDEMFNKPNGEQRISLLPYFNEPHKSAFFRLMELPWFNRLWIVQEFMLPPHVELFLGQDHINFTKFNHFVKLLFYIFMKNLSWPELQGARGRRIGSTILLFQLREEAKAGPQKLKAFIHYVELHCVRSCANARDHIFGLLGLCDPILDIIQPNYNDTVESVYLSFAYAMLKEQGPYILHFANRRVEVDDTLLPRNLQRQISSVSLPSWVPDWRYTMAAASLCSGSFDSATALTHSLSPEEPNLPLIGITGVRVDTVTAQLSAIFPDLESSSLAYIWENEANRILELEKLFVNFLPEPSCQFYPTGENLEIAFIRTLVLNNRYDTSTLFSHLSKDEEHFRKEWEKVKLRLVKNESQTNLTSATKVVEMGLTQYETVAAFISLGRTFFITSRGYIGVGTLDMREGDAVVIFDGAKLPFILRPIAPNKQSTKMEEASFNTKEQWEIIGDCYLHGFMDNEVTQPEHQEKKETFWIS